MTNLRKLFGKRIAQLRKNKNMTQLQFSEKIEISLPALGDIETGANFPRPETIEKIKNALECEYRDLFNFNDKNKIDVAYEEIKFYVDYLYQNNKDMLLPLREYIILLL